MYMDYSMKRVKMFSIQFLTAPCCSVAVALGGLFGEVQGKFWGSFGASLGKFLGKFGGSSGGVPGKF